MRVEISQRNLAIPLGMLWLAALAVGLVGVVQRLVSPHELAHYTSALPRGPWASLVFFDPCPSRRGCSIAAPVHSVVQVVQPDCQTAFVVAPRYAVYPGCGLSLQGVEAFPKQVRCHVVQQGGPPSTGLPPRCVPSPCQSDRLARFPTLGSERGFLVGVPLGRPPSLHGLRRRGSGFVRPLRRYYGTI